MTFDRPPSDRADAPRLPRALLTGVVAMAVVLVPLVGGAVRDSAAAAPAGAEQRTSRMDLAVRSQTYDAATHRWTIQLEAVVDSNAVCVPAVFDCIVAPVAAPSGVTLTGVSCQSLFWNHLIVFRDHCMRQIGFAGFGQRFRFSYVTDPSVDGTIVPLQAEFGRGVLPYMFQRLAAATVQVDLRSQPTLSKDCPEEVDAGQPITCTVTVANPTALAVSGIDLDDVPSGVLASQGTLVQASGPGTFTCVGLGCQNGTLAPGETATFTYAATAPSSPTGGDAANQLDLTWGPGIGSASVTEPITVKGTGDTDLTVDKVASQSTVAPGGAVSYTVTVTNTGTLAASGVTLADTVPPDLQGAVMAFQSGVGTWSCSAATCTTATMPVGTATFTVTGTVSATAGPGPMVNEIGVQWANDTYGPDFPVTSAADITVDPPPTPSTTTTVPTTTAPTSAVPARLAFTG